MPEGFTGAGRGSRREALRYLLCCIIWLDEAGRQTETDAMTR